MAASRPDTNIPTKTEDPEEDDAGALVSCKPEEVWLWLKKEKRKYFYWIIDKWKWTLKFWCMICTVVSSLCHHSISACPAIVLLPCLSCDYSGGHLLKHLVELQEQKKKYIRIIGMDVVITKLYCDTNCMHALHHYVLMHVILTVITGNHQSVAVLMKWQTTVLILTPVCRIVHNNAFGLFLKQRISL